MTPEAAAGVAVMLYTAAGRRPGEAEIQIWVNSLASLRLGNEAAQEVALAMIREVDLGQRAPSVALFGEYHRAWKRRHDPDPMPALPGDPGPGPEPYERKDARKAKIAEARAVLNHCKEIPGPTPRRHSKGEQHLWLPSDRA